MREELLAHLTAIFDEEAQRLGDERAALERAKQRFGDPGELTGQLQQAVPRWDRCRSVLENMGYRPSESAWHLAARHFLVMLLIYLLWLPIWMLAFQGMKVQVPAETQRLIAFILVGAVILVALFNVILSIVLAPLLNKFGPALASGRRGTRPAGSALRFRSVLRFDASFHRGSGPVLADVSPSGQAVALPSRVGIAGPEEHADSRLRRATACHPTRMPPKPARETRHG